MKCIGFQVLKLLFKMTTSEARLLLNFLFLYAEYWVSVFWSYLGKGREIFYFEVIVSTLNYKNDFFLQKYLCKVKSLYS